MSAERHLHDAYDTPRWAVRRLLEAVSFRPNLRLLEPCAGRGNIIREFDAHMGANGGLSHRWTAVDIRHEVIRDLVEIPSVHSASHSDFLKLEPNASFDVVLSNPPYSNAMQFVQACWPWASQVVLLLRLNFLASARRAEWMRANMPDIYVLPNRPSFRPEGGTDAWEYAWFCWTTTQSRNRRSGRVELLASTPLEERREAEERG